MTYPNLRQASVLRPIIAVLVLSCFGLPARGAHDGSIGLFGNLTYRDTQDHEFRSKPFNASLDLYAAGRLSNRWSGLLEFVLEREKGFSEAEMERINLTYEHSTALRLGAGRFHTPLGYWNKAYHHGRQLIDTVERPFFLEFEDSGRGTGILPFHTVGLQASGVRELTSGSFSYNLLAGSAHRMDSSEWKDPGAAELQSSYRFEDSGQLSWTARGRFHSSNDHFQMGLSGRDHPIVEDGSFGDGAITAKGEELFNQQILAVDMRYRQGRWEVFGEYFYIRSRDQFASQQRFDSRAYYAQLAYQLTPSLRGVYRYARLDFDQDDPYYQVMGSREETHNTFTVRYDLDLNHTLKLEYEAVDGQSSDHRSPDIYRFQWSFHWF